MSYEFSDLTKPKTKPQEPPDTFSDSKISQDELRRSMAELMILADHRRMPAALGVLL